MAFGRRTGATAAAILPAALAGAALVAAPFAGTTTAPLAKSTANATHVTHTTAAQSVNDGMRVDVPVGSVVTLAAAEVALAGVGAGVIVVVRRRRVQLAEA